MPQLINQAPIKIIPYFISAIPIHGPVISVDSAFIDSFDIVTPDGFIYRFIDKEYTGSSSFSATYTESINSTNKNHAGIVDLNNNPIDVQTGCSYNGPGGGATLGQGIIDIGDQNNKASSWQLNKIFNENKQLLCSLSYKNSKYKVLNFADASISNPNFVQPGSFNRYSETSISSLRYNSKRIDKIIWPEGEVRFYANQDRQDLATYNGFADMDKALDSIVVVNYKNEPITKFRFYHSYFTSSCSGTLAFEKLRLKLDSVQVYNIGLANPPYQFEYQTTTLPCKTSMETDFWGYYNTFQNEFSASTFPEPADMRFLQLYVYPTDTANALYNNSIYSIYPRTTYNGNIEILEGYSRDPENNTAGIIKIIRYPTGGYDEFIFEPHQFVFDGDQHSGGGFRIRKFERNYGNGQPTKSWNLSYKLTNNQSSGILLTLPDFGKIYVDNYTTPQPDHTWGYSEAYKYTVRHYKPNNQLLTHNGSHVIYSRVEVAENNGNGKTVYEFNVPVSQATVTYGSFNGEPIYQRSFSESFEHIGALGDVGVFNFGGKPNHHFPYPPNPNMEWTTGDLLKKSVYNQAGELIYEMENTYEIKDIKKIYAVKINHYRQRSAYYTATNFSLLVLYYDQFFGKYYYISSWKVLSKTVEKQYEQGSANDVIVKTTDFIYANPLHKQLSFTITNGSNGEYYVSEYKYPQDFGFVSGSVTVDETKANNELISRNMITPVQTTLKLVRGGTTTILDAGLVTYQINSSNHIHPYKSYQLEIEDPVSSINPTVFAASSFTKDDQFILKSTTLFDDQCNIKSIIPLNGPSVTYHWGYTPVFSPSSGKLYPVAITTGARYNQCYFQNFEDEASANTSNFKTGIKGWNGNYTISGAGILSGKYIVAYWEYLSSEWKIKTYSLNYSAGNNISISSSGIIDDISILPVNSTISSYTYHPLKGIISTSTENRNINYYSFDPIGRLSQIKDLDKNIISLFKYHIK